MTPTHSHSRGNNAVPTAHRENDGDLQSPSGSPSPHLHVGAGRGSADRLAELEGALEFVARFACTKPDLSANECLGAIAHHPTVKAVIDKWLSAEPAQRHWKLRKFQ